MLIRTVRDLHGLEIDRDLAERMRSTIVPALQDLAAATAAVDTDGVEPSDFEAALLDLAPDRVRAQAARFGGGGA
ncbi:MAG: hypothetical protein RIB84_17865 [Sneathiellaceae bacterium]